MIVMPLSNRRQYLSASSTGELPLGFDVESPANDLATRHVLPAPPPPPLLPSSRLRPLPMMVQADTGRWRSPSSYLKRVWQQVASRGYASTDGEKPTAKATLNSFGGSDRDDHAPASAEGIYEFDNSRQQTHQQQPRRHRSGSGRGRRSWVRLKVIGFKISLLFVAGALIFDLYLACLGSHTNEDSGDDILFASFPTETNQLGQKSQSSIGARYSQGRDRDTRNNAALFKGNPSKSASGRASPPFFGHGLGIKHQVTQASVKAGEQQSIEVNPPKKTGWALDDAISKPRRFPKPGEDRAGRGPQQRLGLDPFGGQRVAVVVPYVGRDLPAWWDAFADQAGHNDGLFDWIIFCDQKLVREKSPPNIKFFPMTTRRMAWLLAGVFESDDLGQLESSIDDRGIVAGDKAEMMEGGEGVDKKASVGDGHRSGKTYADNGDAEFHAGVVTAPALASTLAARKRAASLLYQLLITSPYFLVEFKPALGWLFREYLVEYSHWAFGDLDVLFGDMRRGWLEPDELQKFDIITFSFGDQYRAYLRGQLTIHKNRLDVNRIWRRCSHLTSYAERLEAFRLNHGLNLESAEGCYSLAAASDPSLKIKFSVKALSDVDEEDKDAAIMGSGREVVVDGDGLVTLCPDLSGYSRPVDGWGIRSGDAAVAPAKMQDAVGPIVPVKRADASEGIRCEHWIKPEHQTCVQDVGARHTLFLIGGEYFKQEFINNAVAAGGRGCRTGAFYHFQKHKRNYRSWNSHAPVQPAHFGVAAGAGGIIPLPATGWRERVSGPGFQPPAEHSQKLKYYCLGWTERRQSHSLDSGRPEQVCAVKVSSKEVVTVVDTRQTIPGGSDRTGRSSTALRITLGAVGEPRDLDLFMLNAAEWPGPKIFAMALDADELATTQQLDTIEATKRVRGGVLIVALVRPPPTPGMPRVAEHFPLKALTNLVTDLCDGRYLLSLPRSTRLSPHAFQAVAVQLLSSRRRRSHSSSFGRPGSTQQEEPTVAARDGPRSTAGIPGPVTLVIPFDEVEKTSPPRDRGIAPDDAEAAAADGTFGSRGVDTNNDEGDSNSKNSKNKNNSNKSSSSSRHTAGTAAHDVTSAPAAAAAAAAAAATAAAAAAAAAAASASSVTAGEDAAGGNNLGLERARENLALAARAEAAAAKEAIEAERTATAIAQAAAAAIGPSSGSETLYSSRDDDGGGSGGGDGGVANGINTSRGASATGIGTRRYGRESGVRQGVEVVAGSAGPPGTRKGPARSAGSMAGSPLEISFAKPAHAGTTIRLADTSFESSDRESAARAGMGAMAMRFRSHDYADPVDAPVPSIAIQRQRPSSSQLGPPYPAPTKLIQQQDERQQPKQRRGQTRVANTSQGQAVRRWRGGWGGGDALLTSFTSPTSSIAAAPATVPKVQPAGTTPRRLATLPGDALQRGRGNGVKAAWRSESGSKSDAASTVGAASEEQQEAEWIRKLLFSGPGVPGLVVDLWSPGPIFLRHIEEFGDSGCMDMAYVLGLWRAGSSFEVVQGATLTSPSSPSSTSEVPPEGAVYEARRRAFTSEEAAQNKFSVPGGECLRSEAVANTASIYSAYLLQVANFYRTTWSGVAGRQGKLDDQDHWDHLNDQER